MEHEVIIPGHSQASICAMGASAYKYTVTIRFNGEDEHDDVVFKKEAGLRDPQAYKSESNNLFHHFKGAQEYVPITVIVDVEGDEKCGVHSYLHKTEFDANPRVAAGGSICIFIEDQYDKRPEREHNDVVIAIIWSVLLQGER